MSSSVEAKKSAGPDMELKRAFAELQAKTGETRRRIKIMDMQVENERRSITHAELTEAEVRSMPEGTRLYNSVGRMFVLASMGEQRRNLYILYLLVHQDLL